MLCDGAAEVVGEKEILRDDLPGHIYGAAPS